METSWAAVIVSAGHGRRFGRPKQFIDVCGIPMAGWSLRLFAGMPEIDALVVVTETECIGAMRDLAARFAPALRCEVVEGGASRQASVRNGLLAVPQRCDGVLVHDGARPLVRQSDVRAAMRAVAPGRAAVLAVPIVDTVKVVDPTSMTIVETLDRRRLWAAQTPQCATTIDLARAHERAHRDGTEATDDAALLERIGIEIIVVESSSENVKVTRPEDLARVEAALRDREGSVT